MTLDDLNDLDPFAAKEAFRLCCGSLRWAEAMTASRPFQSLDAMRRRGDEIWTSLGRTDWLEAFDAHPKIGERRTMLFAEQQCLEGPDSPKWHKHGKVLVVADNAFL